MRIHEYVKDDNNNNNGIYLLFKNRPMDTERQGATTSTAQVSFKRAIVSL